MAMSTHLAPYQRYQEVLGLLSAGLRHFRRVDETEAEKPRLNGRRLSGSKFGLSNVGSVGEPIPR